MLLAFSTGVDRPLPTAFAALPAKAPQLEEITALAPLVRVVVAAVLAVGRAHADVDDATSETMRRAVEGLGRLREGEPLRPWLVGIARHVALDARRARGRTARRIASPHDDQENPLVDRAMAPGPNPFEQLAQARRDERVRNAPSCHARVGRVPSRRASRRWPRA
jgi:DNA-directed RNA polymerase specialized sigma24 family protein